MLTSPMGKNMNITYQGLKTQTPTLVGKNNKIPHQGMDAKPKHNFMNEIKKNIPIKKLTQLLTKYDTCNRNT